MEDLVFNYEDIVEAIAALKEVKDCFGDYPYTDADVQAVVSMLNARRIANRITNAIEGS